MLVVVSTSEQRDPRAGRRIDVPGLLTIGLGLALVVLALVEGKTWGWGSARTLGVFGLGVALLVAFWFIEHRVKHPIVEFDLFRNRPYFGRQRRRLLPGRLLLGGDVPAAPVPADRARQQRAAAGVMVLPITAPMIVISPLGGRLMACFGTRPLMTAGMAFGTIGLVVMALVKPTSGYDVLFVGYLLFGIALGCVYAPMSAAAMMAMPRTRRASRPGCWP